MKLTTADIRSIGYMRKDEEVAKKIRPWLWAMLGIIIICTIALAISTTDMSPTVYTTSDGDEVVIAPDYATFNGQIMEKEANLLVFPVVYICATIAVFSVVTLLGLIIYAMTQAKKAGNQFLDEWLKEKGVANLF